MDYPPRQPYFAQKFIRLMTKTAAAQELGPSACWMLSVIACQEDAKRYTEPAKYYYEQLMPLCGFTSRKQLRAAIEKAESLGWLNYQAGTKGIPGKFFVAIPERFQDLQPTGCDEEFSSDSELKAELKVHRKRNCKGNTSIPIPIPKESTRKRESFDPLSVDVPIELQSELFRLAWADWVSHRAEIKKPLTPTSCKQQLRTFSNWGQSRSIAAITYTIAQGWQGIREPDTAPSCVVSSTQPKTTAKLAGKGKPLFDFGPVSTPSTEQEQKPCDDEVPV